MELIHESMTLSRCLVCTSVLAIWDDSSYPSGPECFFPRLSSRSQFPTSLKSSHIWSLTVFRFQISIWNCFASNNLLQDQTSRNGTIVKFYFCLSIAFL
jgi:hypothetical protein